MMFERLKDRWSVFLARAMIRDLRKGYGGNCPDFEPECASCRAGVVIKFLEEHIDLLNWFKTNKKWRLNNVDSGRDDV